MKRASEVIRTTKETDIRAQLCIDGGEICIDTGIGFFDHMLTSFAFHGEFGLELKVKGDLYVDAHHSAEDTGIVLGTAFKQCLGDRKGIERFSSFYVPMDEALGFAAVDISGRPYLVYDAQMPQESAGEYEMCLNEEFFRAFAYAAGITLHLKAVYGKNSHHMTEALFKACAKALKNASKITSDKTVSTKGVL
jgi:imidazoleglycerol-phosphate dehydratase